MALTIFRFKMAEADYCPTVLLENMAKLASSVHVNLSLRENATTNPQHFNLV